VTLTLAYLAPLLVLLVVLLLGRYPGERALRRRLERPRRPRVPAPAASHRTRVRRGLPRGGALLAAGLAGRAPPLGSA
jgi:hypothetical protein